MKKRATWQPGGANVGSQLLGRVISIMGLKAGRTGMELLECRREGKKKRRNESDEKNGGKTVRKGDEDEEKEEEEGESR